MGKKNISDDTKKFIKQLHAEGKSYSEIGARLNLSKSTVALWVKRFAETHGEVPPTLKSSGAPRKTSVQADRLLKRKVQCNPALSARQLKQILPEGSN